MLSLMKGAAKDVDCSAENAAELYRKRLALAQGEIEGYACKLSGFERALQEVEMQLAEKDLQVAMLKSVLRDTGDPVKLERCLSKVLDHNMQLQQRLQEVTTSASPSPNAATVRALTPLTEQVPAWCLTQMAMLRKALTVANMRLTAAGIMPVAATSDLLTYEECDSTALQDLNSAFAIPTPQASLSLRPSSSANSSCSKSNSKQNRATPDLPPLNLYLHCLSSASVEGTHTPLALDAQHSSRSSCCATPTEPGSIAAAEAAATHSAMADMISSSGEVYGSSVNAAAAAADSDDACSELSSGDADDELHGIYVNSDWCSSIPDSCQLPIKDNPLFAPNTCPYDSLQ